MDDADPHKNVEINDARLQFLEASQPDIELDAVHPDPDDLVDLEDACRRCGERRVQKLVWQSDFESIRCESSIPDRPLDFIERLTQWRKVFAFRVRPGRASRRAASGSCPLSPMHPREGSVTGSVPGSELLDGLVVSQ